VRLESSDEQITIKNMAMRFGWFVDGEIRVSDEEN
jgi:hypothetical protein